MGYGSPPTYTTVCNASDFQEPGVSETADVTNVGDLWRARVATLLDLGKIAFKVFWIMTEPTHQNAVAGAVYGLRYLWTNRLLAAWKVIYPDGNNSADYFLAYVTKCDVSAKVGGVFEMSIELSNSTIGGSPTVGSSAPSVV